MYAHFLFEAFDTNNNGAVSFEVGQYSAVQVIDTLSGSFIPPQTYT